MLVPVHILSCSTARVRYRLGTSEPRQLAVYPDFNKLSNPPPMYQATQAYPVIMGDDDLDDDELHATQVLVHQLSIYPVSLTFTINAKPESKHCECWRNQQPLGCITAPRLTTGDVLSASLVGRVGCGSCAFYLL